MQAEDGWGGGTVWSALAMSGSTISAGGVSSILGVFVFIESGIIALLESHLQCCCPLAMLCAHVYTYIHTDTRTCTQTHM